MIAYAFLWLINSILDWGDVATWFLGLATLALFIVGFIQIRTERKYRLKRENETEARRLRSQAELVSAWIVQEGIGKSRQEGYVVHNPVAWVAVDNQSSQPVYQVIVCLYAITSTGDAIRVERPAGRACVAVVPPGRGYVQVGADYAGMNRRPGIEVGFQDSLGQAWARRAWGELIRLTIPTVHYYRVRLPTRWTILEHEVPEEEDWDPFSGVIDPDEWRDMLELYGNSPETPTPK